MLLSISVLFETPNKKQYPKNRINDNWNIKDENQLNLYLLKSRTTPPIRAENPTLTNQTNKDIKGPINPRGVAEDK
tara:strand:- start:6 stop:233 length:228 start_codon:yes stop_codon:yes gene_type:complete